MTAVQAICTALCTALVHFRSALVQANNFASASDESGDERALARRLLWTHDMKKNTGDKREVRRLALRKELIRHLDHHQLVVVVGGCPQCTVTRTSN
jgi:hypothetical protein